MQQTSLHFGAKCSPGKKKKSDFIDSAEDSLLYNVLNTDCDWRKSFIAVGLVTEQIWKKIHKAHAPSVLTFHSCCNFSFCHAFY